ncbi:MULTISPECIES: DNA repair protein RadA [Hydrocarboniphaga]|uniref:DNA repair protein RadA n=1 Tax=Hydrocarboniphaga effusa AP103 TaxID=1172194 RepID=I8HXR3_9GAMM|nr:MULTISPECIES: DNA repair protein RadA [Hydrocarboniphaga]EIT68216.1 Methylated-DNA--(protein)-cysteine S-methyltransferase [Hydrocarboniphaga effusa AP103]MDZ4079581.1 DNA repair protein RadA [Hydrocarboniphaga sp.]
MTKLASRKNNVRYVCQSCGAQTTKWAGQCAECGAWNTLVETVAEASSPARRAAIAGQVRIERLHEVSADDAPRVSSGLSEMDRVLGGGIVPGAVILIGGDPGIGKSTLLLQVLAAVEGRLDTLYVSGEESLSQVSLRASRLGLPRLDLPVLAETSVDLILDQLTQHRPGFVVIDSIQTLYTEALDSAPGSVSQIRECAARLVRFAKASNTTVILVGHVTKEGAIAGPRVLEHMVDTVLYFEHDAGSRYRIVRAVKNRFGAVNELGVFAMTDGGLKEVSNPSALFLSRHEQPVSGSVITVTRQGSRPLLVEVQALVDASHIGSPRRVTLGFEGNRLNMLLAVLHRHAGIALSDQDVFANVVGGMRIQEPAADLPLLLATLSSFRGQPVSGTTIVFGEVGLAGEIRPVQAGEERLIEAAKHGFKRAIVPEANKPRKNARLGIEVTPVARLEQAIDAL